MSTQKTETSEYFLKFLFWHSLRDDTSIMALIKLNPFLFFRRRCLFVYNPTEILMYIVHRNVLCRLNSPTSKNSVLSHRSTELFGLANCSIVVGSSTSIRSFFGVWWQFKFLKVIFLRELHILIFEVGVTQQMSDFLASSLQFRVPLFASERML